MSNRPSRVLLAYRAAHSEEDQKRMEPYRDWDRERERIDHMEVHNYYPGYGDETESRFRDRRGREHYDNGRYALRSEREYRVITDTYEPYDRYDDYDEYRPVVGFTGDPMPQRMRYITPMPRNEMTSMQGSMERGHGVQSGPAKLTRQKAEEWVRSMQCADGSRGEHWTYEQTTSVMRSQGYNHDPVEWYAVMNMLYSDHCMSARKYGLDIPEYYACLANEWLSDPDAAENKLAMYRAYVTR